MNDLSLQAAVVVNSEQAETAFDRVGDKAQQMANEVSTSATKAGQAVDKIGDGAGASAEKFTRAESRISASIKRATTELELLGKTASQRLEFNIADKGLDASKFEPALKKLREIEAQALQAQRAATGSLDSMGMSAKATAAAMRGVPAQFQDIIVSLQGGQAPMTVLLQQGSQLSGMFGGAGNAAKALGGYIMGLINPFTLAAAAVAGLGIAMASINGKDAALLALSTQLTGTGRASAAAVGDIKALVKELNLVPGVSKASATAIITEFAKVSGIGGELFKSLGASVADFAAATGTDLPTAAKKLADAFADPAKGAQALEGVLGTLTAAQILTIEKMAAMGDKSGAQVAMMDALKQATEGLAKQGMTPLGEATDKMSNAWDALTSSIGNSEAFRTANSWLATLIEKVAELTVRLSQMKPPTWLQFLPVVGPAIGALTMAAGASSGSRSVSGVVGTWDEGGATGSWGPTASETEQQVKAAIAATRGYETQSAAMEKLRGVVSQAKDALKELESQNRGGSVEAMRLRDSIAAMNEKLADMGKKGAPKGPTKEAISEYDKLIKKLSEELPRAAAEAEAAQMGYNKAQTEFLALAGSPAWASFSNAQRAVVASMFEGKIASEQAGEAAKELSKAYAEAAAERIKTIQSMERAADSLQSQNDALRDEIELIGLSTEQQTLVLQQRNDVIILTKEATLAELERQSAITGTQTRVEIALASEIDALKERNALLGAKGVKNAAVDAAKSAADEWKKTSDKINDTLTDALMRGFESGKDFAKNLRDTVVNMFKTMVLRPVISAIVNPVAGAVTGALGFSGAANAATGGGGIMGMASNSSSAYNLVSGGLNVASQAGTWLSGKGTELALQYMGESAGTLLNNFALGMSSTSSMSAAAAALQGTGAEIAGLAVGSLMNGFAGYGISSALSGGYSAGGWVNTAAGIASAIPGVGPIAGVIGGAANRLFGRKLKDAGIEGTFGGETGFEGNSFEYYKGGLFRSNKTKRSPLDEETRSALADNFNVMRVATAAMADVLGLGTDAISNFTASVKISLKGLSPEDAEKAIQAEFDKIAESLARQTLGTDAFSRAGESSVQTLTRLSSSLTTVNSAFKMLDIEARDMQFANSLTGGKNASDYLDKFGGAEVFSQLTASYYDAFYSEAEKTANVTKSITETLASVGLAMPTTREAFRDLTNEYLAMGIYGADTAVALLSVSNAFANIIPAAADATAAMEEQARAAEQAAQEQARAAQAQAEAMAELQIEILRAQGREMDAVALERQREIDALRATAPALVDLQRQLYAVQDAASSSVASLQDSFSAFTSMAGASASYGDASGLQDYLGMLQGSYSNALSLTSQQAVLGAIAGTEQAIAGANAGAAAAERSAITARRDALQEELRTAQNLLSVAQSLGDYVKSMYASESSGLSEADRMTALRSQYDTLLSAAQGGDANAMGQLQGVSSDYLALARSQASSQFEYSTLSASIAGELGAVAAISQASARSAQQIARQQIDALEVQMSSLTGISSTTRDLTKQLLERARQQFDQDMRNATQQLISTDSVAAGLAKLPPELAAILSGSIASALGPTLQSIAAMAASGARASSVTTITGAASTGGISVDLAKQLSAGATGAPSDAYKYVTGAGGMGTESFYSNLATNAQKYLAAGDAAGMVADMQQHGISLTDAAAALGVSTGDVAAWLLENGAKNLPKLATGTNYVPRDMLAQIHEGEAVVPKAYNPWAGQQGMQQNTARLEALVEQLIDDNRRQAGEIVRLNNRLTKVVEKWDGEGMPTTRLEAVV